MVDERKWRCPECGQEKLYWEACNEIEDSWSHKIKHMCDDCVLQEFGNPLDEIPEEYRIEEDQ